MFSCLLSSSLSFEMRYENHSNLLFSKICLQFSTGWQSPKLPFLVSKEVLIRKFAVPSHCPRVFFYNAKVEMVSWNCLLPSQVLVFGCCSLVKPSACGPLTPFGPSKLESLLHLKVVLSTGDLITGEYQCYLTSPYYTHWAVCFSSFPASRSLPKSANKCNMRFLKLV